MFRQKDTLDMHVCKQKNTSQNIYMYVQVERYLGYACMQQKYFTKYIYVCLGSKIPWICMYIAKYLMKKRRRKKKQTRKRNKQIKKKKKKKREKRKISCLAEKPTCF